MSNPNDDALLRTTLDEMVEGLQVIDREWRYRYLNRAALAHSYSTLDKLLGNTMMSCYPGIEKTPFFRHLEYVMKHRESRRLENEFQYPDGTKRWFELYIEPHSEGALIRSVDIGERKKLEEQLVQAQKLEAVGRLAGGVAHDLNNMLGTMLVHCEMAADSIADPTSDVSHSLNRIQEAITQAAKLTKQLLAFGRKQVLELKVVALNRFLEDFRETLSHHMTKSTQVKFVLAPDIKSIRIDPSQLEQIVFNLCNNAKDAMGGVGTLMVETSNATLDEEYSSRHPEVAPGEYVMLAISDTGHGMDKETIRRVFEPFFTTKDRGKGTGLGLAAVHGVVRQSLGHIIVYSEKARGTTFKLYFPAVEESKLSVATPAPAARKREPGSRETILFVEDDGLLREAYSDGLRDAGYRLLVAESAEQAETLFREHGDEIDLLLTDIVLPGADGHKLAQSLLDRRDNLKVIFMSGYTENIMVSQGLIATSSVLLTKPTPMKTLLATVRGSLDGKLLKGLVDS